ncbi:MAG: endonuclease [Fidelibacterota bacterium]
MNMIRITIRAITSLLLSAALLVAAVPPGYYDDAADKSGNELRLALHNIIDGHTQLTYDQIWDAFEETDLKANGRIWDMYTGIEFVYGDDQSTGDNVENTYNREHSWPKSWANNTTPHYTDLFHLYPVQALSNSHRSNLPYGEVGESPTYVSDNGTKKGEARSGLGYTGTVFEPVDDYKGDFARTYFYISTRYYTEDADWDISPMTDKCELEDWAVDMLLDWHHLDPVSQKELDRNEAVYVLQGNRNPFIDHPAYADSVWTVTNGDPVIPGENIDSTRIFFSEYIEGSSYNKALEIYNNADTVVDLSLVEIKLYSNGSISPNNTLTLGGSLEPGEVFVLAHNNADAEILSAADLTTGGVTNFNGNDAIELYYNNSIIDILGETGSDAPYAEDVTLVRKATVMQGNTSYTATEWNTYATDEFDYLGMHFVESDDPLAVSLLDFSAQVKPGFIVLTWVTGSETENAAFHLYRDSSLLAEIPGAGTSSETHYYEYADRFVSADKSYCYVLADIDFGGNITFHDTLEVVMEFSSPDMIPGSFVAGETYPNPFNPSAVLPLFLRETTSLRVSLHDVRGKKLRDIVRGNVFEAGEHRLPLNFPGLSAGIYFLHLSDGNYHTVRKFVFLK